jgi:DNA-binding transcriptional ArsR family regulator
MRISIFAFMRIYKSSNMKTDELRTEIYELHAEICSALADPRRILMFYALAEKNANVGELAEAVGISQSAASRHLKIMRERGLVHSVRKGTSVEYQLSDLRLIQALDLLRSVLGDQLRSQANLVEMID